MTQNRSQSGAAAMFRALKRPAQARLSLFCFPHGGGGATSYQAWVDELPDDVALYAYAPPGRGPRLRDPAHASLTEAAEAAARMLCAEHAELLTGAFALFGHSVGALLAFETARALEARGAPPPALVGLSGHAAPALASRAARTAHLDDDALFEEIRALGGLPDVAPDEEAQLRELVLAPTRADFRLAEAHHIAPETQLAAPLALFAGADDEAASPQAMEGWRKHSSNVSAAYCFAGGHFFTETACAEVVATLLLGVAQAIQARPRSILRGPAEPAPIEMGLDELFERQAAASPDATALVGADRTLTYRELDEEADLLAAELIARGVQTDRIVALFLETSADFMVGYIAALKAGGAYLQLDIRAPEATLAGALDKAAPIAILTRPDLIDKLPDAWRGKAVALGPGWAMRLANAGRRPPPRERRRSCGQDLAYAVMTSGTTGAPKAILCPHQGAVISYDWRYTHLPYGPNEREGCNVFLVWEALRPLLRGAECRLIPDDVIYDPPRLAAFLAEHRITRMLFTPSLLEQFLAGDEDLAALTPELKLILLNGEVVTSALLARARARLPQARIVNDYSISETHDVGHIDLTDLELSRGRFAPAGRVMSNVAVYILDCDALEAGRYEPTPWGVAGEIFVGGPTIARGYLGDEAQTAERFLPDAFSAAPGARMFRTGDLGRFTPDGALEISGRAKFMIKLRGYSVVPSAIEATAAELDEVAAAALVPVLDPATSQPESLALFAAPSVGRMIDVEQLRAHLAASLPHYAVPAQIELLPALPVDPRTGKLDRKKLPKPTPRARKEAAELEARSNRGDSDVAAKLAQLWAEILGRPPEQADANFFELGGHSLAAARLARRIETAFGRQMRVVDLFDAPTLAAQAALLAVEKAKAPAELRGGGARGGA
ncbi:MAG: AMP-binding protein, partial [Neomegalonema sp.]|nr:AMP-binding protein [Neomegalonema sp.]